MMQGSEMEGVRRRDPRVGAEINTVLVPALQYKRRTYHQRQITNTIPVFTCSPHHLPLLSSTCCICYTIPSMAPRTRQSQTKGTAVGTMNNENEHPIPLETSNLANVNTSARSRVPARRVIPGNPNQCQHAGKRSLICRELEFIIGMNSTWETHLRTSRPTPKRGPNPYHLTDSGQC